MYEKEPKSKYDTVVGNDEECIRRPEACTVMLWNQFIENPGLLHPQFERGYRTGQTYTDILDLTTGFENEKLTMFEVYNIDEFRRISHELQSRCLLFKTYIEHERVCKISETPKTRHSTERWTDELAVLINTDHPEIRNDLRSKLDQAKTDVETDRKFCLRLDFGQGLKKWFGDVCERSRISMYPKSYDTDTLKNISVFVLNCSKPIPFFMSKCAMVCCFPCWLISGGCCYYIYRKKTVDDIVKKFDYRVTFEARGAIEKEYTPCCGCGKIYHLPVLYLQMRSGDFEFYTDY